MTVSSPPLPFFLPNVNGPNPEVPSSPPSHQPPPPPLLLLLVHTLLLFPSSFHSLNSWEPQPPLQVLLLEPTSFLVVVVFESTRTPNPRTFSPSFATDALTVKRCRSTYSTSISSTSDGELQSFRRSRSETTWRSGRRVRGGGSQGSGETFEAWGGRCVAGPCFFLSDGRGGRWERRGRRKEGGGKESEAHQSLLPSFVPSPSLPLLLLVVCCFSYSFIISLSLSQTAACQAAFTASTTSTPPPSSRTKPPSRKRIQPSCRPLVQERSGLR
ncbi:hypothetical protein BDY24DRAFT_285227 [Mrakia frigida]|uniref:uncharacterized protein n=1 Tax=Mrakia frigida TaxID=29902 RepID=UPI003FCC1611